MTTQTKAKRTAGEATIRPAYPTTINLGAANRKAKIVIIGMVMDGEDVANAEYIRKAWNMHEELVVLCKELLDSDEGGYMHGSALTDRATTLLSKAQP